MNNKNSLGTGESSLLNCFVLIAQHKGVQLTAETVLSAIPNAAQDLAPHQFVEAAEKFGLQAESKQRDLSDLNNLILPAVILLKGDVWVILEKIDHQKGYARVIFAEHSHEAETIDLEKLSEEYAGHVLLIKEAYQFESNERGKEKPKRYWLLDTLWNFRNLYFRVIAASILINLFVVATPLFIMNVYDRVVPNQAIETLWVLATGIFIVLGFDLTLKVLRSYFIDVVGRKADLIMSSAILEHSLGVSLEDPGASSSVRAGQLNTFEKIREFVGSATVTTFVDLPFIIIFLLVIKFIGGPLYIPSLGAVILVITLSMLLSLPLFSAVKDTFGGSAQKTALLTEAIEGVETVKSHAAQGLILGKWQKFSSIVADAAVRSRLYSSLAVYLTQFCIALSTIIVVIMGVYLIGSGELTTGALIACVILNSRALAPLAQVTQLLVRYHQTKCAYEAIDQIMQSPSDSEGNKSYVVMTSCRGGITFQGVNFQYPGQLTSLFKDLNLQIRPKEHVAIIGNIGSGKSTLLKLINGLYHVQDGAVLIDEIDLRQLRQADIHRHIGYLNQNPRLFTGSARENIAFKAPWEQDSAVINAAKLSGASRFLGGHADGYSYQLRENGRGLSNGQIQTIALARAYFTNPEILLLDEPTTSMDSASEQLFIQSMNTFAKNKTVIIVTHKPSIVQIVDRIILLHQGKIVMDGPRDQVLAAIQERQSQERKIKQNEE